MAVEAKKVGIITSETIVLDLKEKLKDIEGLFFLSFTRLPAYPFNVLRNNLRAAGARVVITKNSLFSRTFKDLGWGDSPAFLESETAAVLVYDKDISGVCRTLVDFSLENEFLKIKGGLIHDKKVTPKEVEAIAKLPAKQVLMGMTVSALASPLTGFLSTMNQIILKVVWLVDELKKVKEKKQ